MKRLWQFIMPEQISGEERAYLQTILARILLISLLICGILLVIGLLNHLPSTPSAAGLALVVSGSMLWLTRHGYLAVCRLMFPAFTFSLITSVVVLNDGLHDEGLLAYPVIMVMAGLLLGKRGIVLYTILILGALQIIGYAEIADMLVNRFSTATSYAGLFIIDAFMSFTGALLFLTIDNLTHSLKRARGLYAQVQEELTQRIQTEQALRQAKEEAEFANLAKTNFLRGMSHEVRTPLNQILGFAQILQIQRSGPLTEKQAEQVNKIIASGHHLLELFEDVLNLSRIELGDLKLNRRNIRLKRLLEESLRTVREKDLKPQLTLTLRMASEVEHQTIVGDERKLKQVLFHLLSNAIKFTPDGGAVLLEAERSGEAVIIHVTDTGIGIAPEDQEQIFANFYQVQGGLQDKTPGTGLGLPIARRLVELHGGKLWVTSAGKGQGSCFSFSLPLTL